MSNELILAVVLTIVLVADLIIRSFRNKNKIDDSPKIGEETSKKHRFNFNYFINRKRNIVTFIILGLVLKPAIHYQFYAETEKYVNTESKIPANEKLHDFEKSCVINNNLVSFYGNVFSKAWLKNIKNLRNELEDDILKNGSENEKTHLEILNIMNNSNSLPNIRGSSDKKSKFFSPIKMDYNNYKLYDEAGNQVILEKEGEIVNFFIHPKESRKINLQFHFDNIFKLKLWIFLISYSFMGLLVFLFNDKIQAR
tara:strand:+ start:195 stop:956 length:762 start_codon:yes stop_codon:yes gene_type:complete